MNIGSIVTRLASNFQSRPIGRDINQQQGDKPRATGELLSNIPLNLKNTNLAPSQL